MIQTLLLIAICGLAIAHLLSPRAIEPFSDDDNKFPFVDIERTVAQPVGPSTGHHPLDLTNLENPKPFHPLANGEVLSPTDPRRKVATPYRDLEPDSQADLPSDDDPRDLPWIASWSAADRFARQGHNCAVKYIKDGQDGTTIITTSKSCEAGMPHTRAGGRVIIPDSIPDALQAEIIGHELIHIYQRRYPVPWATFYQRNWAFTLHTKPPTSMPASVVEARRSNPDTFMVPWSRWMGRYWPVPVYTNPKTPNLREAVTVWWDEEDGKLLTEPPTAWTIFFGKPMQNEHPHEMAAVMIVASDTATEAGRRMLNWWLTTGTLIKASRNSLTS